jgi:hypothetical protein
VRANRGSLRETGRPASPRAHADWRSSRAGISWGFVIRRLSIVVRPPPRPSPRENAGGGGILWERPPGVSLRSPEGERRSTPGYRR